MCIVDGCETTRGYIRKGMCPKHYSRMKRRGTTDDPPCTKDGEPMRFILSLSGVASDVCIPWPYARSPDGYGKIYDGRIMNNAHRIVCEIYSGTAPAPEMQATHKCGKGHEGCVNPRHLEWGTSKKNHHDCLIHGTRPRGEAHYAAKLTQAQVREILKREGEASSLVARDYGVAPRTVRDIWRRKSWRCLTAAL